MARDICPGCGKAYNGKRCGNCFYEAFGEEIAHGMHYHEGEPLVVRERPVQNASRSGTRQKKCRTYPGKRKKKTAVSWLAAVVCILLAAVYQMAEAELRVPEEVRADLEWEFPAVETPEPAPEITSFLDGTVLYDADGILILADWREGESLMDSIPVYIQNDSGWDIFVYTERSAVNNCMTEYSFLYSDVEDGSAVADSLWIDSAELERVGIGTISSLSFRVAVYDAEEYDLVGRSQQLTLTAEGVDGDMIRPDGDGTVIYDESGIRITCLGCDETRCEDASIWFLVENSSDRCMQIYTVQAQVNGSDAELYLWSELMPGTFAVTDIWLYPLAEQGMETVEEIDSLEIALGIADSDNWEDWTETDLISIDFRG